MEHRAGWDATFSAPKSISLTALVGGDDRVREAHREAVNVALNELERYTQARIGGNHPAETTGQFVAAKFEHDTARPVDGYAAPQLHTHAVIFNMTERDRRDRCGPCSRTRFLRASSLRPLSINPISPTSSALSAMRSKRARAAHRRSKVTRRSTLMPPAHAASRSRKHLSRSGFSGPEAAQIAAHNTRDKKVSPVSRPNPGRA